MEFGSNPFLESIQNTNFEIKFQKLGQNWKINAGTFFFFPTGTNLSTYLKIKLSKFRLKLRIVFK